MFYFYDDYLFNIFYLLQFIYSFVLINFKNLHRTIREYTILETNKVKYQTQVESIVEAIGGS